jgi:DoxX-like family
VLQVLLALVFLLTGIPKLVRSEASTRAVPWVGRTPIIVVRGIGVLEVLGANGGGGLDFLDAEGGLGQFPRDSTNRSWPTSSCWPWPP